MRFEVPQFIEIEDKIFGPFTWRQFVYIAGGGGFGVMLYLMNVPFIILVLLGGPVIALAMALAFYPINNRPFSIFLESLIAYVLGKKLYLWKKQSEHTYVDPATQGRSTVQSAVVPQTPKTQNLASLSRQLELHALQGDTAANEYSQKQAKQAPQSDATIQTP